MKKLVAGFILGLGFFSVILAQPKESIGLNVETVNFANAMSKYQKENGRLPANWSEIWDGRNLAFDHRYAQDRPLVYRRIAFVNDLPKVSEDPMAPRILAVSRDTVERSWKDKNGDSILQRAVFALTPQNKVRISFIGADKPFWKTDLNKLSLKDPDPSPKQLADTIKIMFEMGFNSDQICAAFGNDDIEVVKKSGALDPAFQRMLDEKPPQLASTPTLAASTPRPRATATPTVASEKFSSNFPVVPVVILAAVIAGAAVFFLRRKTP